MELQELEERVFQIWRGTLNVPNAALDDRLAECGGTSLMLALIVARIQNELGIELEPNAVARALLAAPTARVLAKHVQGCYGSSITQGSGLRNTARGSNSMDEESSG